MRCALLPQHLAVSGPKGKAHQGCRPEWAQHWTEGHQQGGLFNLARFDTDQGKPLQLDLALLKSPSSCHASTQHFLGLVVTMCSCTYTSTVVTRCVPCMLTCTLHWGAEVFGIQATLMLIAAEECCPSSKCSAGQPAQHAARLWRQPTGDLRSA